MKHYIFMLGVFGYGYNAFGMCSPLVLGRTTERLPTTNTNAFIQQELPLNTVHQQCDYQAGGVVITYPVGWLSSSNPNVRVSVQPTTVDSTVQYSVQVAGSTATSTTIRVNKYVTGESCDEGTCYGGVCSNAPYCSRGACVATSGASTCPDCDGSCDSLCSGCSGTSCQSICNRCNGECQGSCNGDGIMVAGNGCVGRAVSCVGFCTGVCATCTGTCSAPFTPGGTCSGICTGCNGICNGTCGGSFTQCGGTSTTCIARCQGNGPCSASAVGSCNSNAYCSLCQDSAFGNGGVGSCIGLVRGFCSQGSVGTAVNPTQCLGFCSQCSSSASGTCNGAPGANAPCTGLCTQCSGSCSGYMDNGGCTGFVEGICENIQNEPWNGYCNLCNDACSGSGTALVGATCINSYNQQQSVEAASGEVMVHVYIVDEPAA